MTTRVSGIFALPFLVRDLMRRGAADDYTSRFGEALEADRMETLRRAGVRPEALHPFTPGGPTEADIRAAQPAGAYEDAVARAEAARPPLRRRLADALGTDAFLSPDFDKLIAGVTGGVQKTKPGERVSEGGTTIYENPRAPLDAGPGRQFLDPMDPSKVLAETPYAPQVLGQGGALVDRGRPSAPGAAVLHVNPETFAPSSGGGAGGGRPKALPLSLIEDEVKAEQGLTSLSGTLWDPETNRPATAEQSARFAARVRERWAQENRGAEPTAPAAPPPVAGAAPAPASSAPVVPAQPLRPATEADAQAAMQEAGGDAKRAGELLRARGLSF